jgi:hypothetical protein
VDIEDCGNVTKKPQSVQSLRLLVQQRLPNFVTIIAQFRVKVKHYYQDMRKSCTAGRGIRLDSQKKTEYTDKRKPRWAFTVRSKHHASFTQESIGHKTSGLEPETALRGRS